MRLLLSNFIPLYDDTENKRTIYKKMFYWNTFIIYLHTYKCNADKFIWRIYQWMNKWKLIQQWDCCIVASDLHQNEMWNHHLLFLCKLFQQDMLKKKLYLFPQISVFRTVPHEPRLYQNKKPSTWEERNQNLKVKKI